MHGPELGYGLILGAGVGLVSETRRTDILAERQARMEEIASERSALIERRCVVAVPTELADYLYVGLRWGEQTYISVHDHHVEPTGLDSFAVAQVDFTRPAWLVRGTLYASELITMGHSFTDGLWLVEGSLTSPSAVFSLSDRAAALSTFPLVQADLYTGALGETYEAIRYCGSLEYAAGHPREVISSRVARSTTGSSNG